MNYNLYKTGYFSFTFDKVHPSQKWETHNKKVDWPSCCCSVLYMLCIAVYMYRSTMMILTSPLSENGKFLAIIGNKFRKQERTRQKRH